MSIIKAREMTDGEIAIEVKQLGAKMFSLQEQLSSFSKRMKELKKERIKRQTKKKQLAVTDHAVVRYLERVKGIDMNQLKRSIVTPELQSAAHVGASSLNVDGMIYCIKGNQLITIKPKGNDGYIRQERRGDVTEGGGV